MIGIEQLLGKMAQKTYTNSHMSIPDSPSAIECNEENTDYIQNQKASGNNMKGNIMTSQTADVTDKYGHLTDSSGYDDDEEGDLIVDEDVSDVSEQTDNVTMPVTSSVQSKHTVTSIEPDSTNRELSRQLNDVSTSCTTASSHDVISTRVQSSRPDVATTNPIRSLEQVVHRLARSNSCSPVSYEKLDAPCCTDDRLSASSSKNRGQVKVEPHLKTETMTVEAASQMSSTHNPMTSPATSTTSPVTNSQNGEMATRQLEQSTKPTFPVPGMFPMPGFPFGMPPPSPFGVYPGMVPDMTGMYPGMMRGMNMMPGMPMPMLPPPGLVPPAGLTTPPTPNSRMPTITSSSSAPLDLSGSTLKRKSPEGQGRLSDGHVDERDAEAKKRRVEQSTPVKPTPVAQPSWFREALSRLASGVNQPETTPKPVNHNAVTTTSTNQNEERLLSVGKNIERDIKYENGQNDISSIINQDKGMPSPSNDKKTTSAFTPLRHTLPRQPMPMSPFAMFPPFFPGMMGYSPMYNPYMMSAFPGSPAHPMMSGHAQKEMLANELKTLDAELNELVSKLGEDSSVFRAQQAFKAAFSTIQSEREKAVASAPSGDVNIEMYFDNQLVSLIRMTQVQLEGEKKALEMGGKLKSEPNSNRLLTTPFSSCNTDGKPRSVTPPEFSKPLHASSPYASNPYQSKPSPHSALRPSATVQGSNPAQTTTPRSTRNLQSTFQGTSPRNTQHPVSRLQSSPIQVQQPSPRQAAQLQPKWLQLSPQDGSNTSAESGFLDSSDTSPTDALHSNRRRLLSNAAVEVLAAWYERHQEHPYPDDEQVEQIAQQAAISDCQRYLEAASFLQNLVYINVSLTEDEKILRYNTLSSLYGVLHMKRKSGFFKRIAAMQCVAPTNPKPGWVQCYYLLLQALDGYDISLDPKYKAQNALSGWPAAQLRVLHELIYSARKMGNPAIAIRHITYLIHTMFDHLVESDRGELVRILQTYTPHCEGGAQTLALENGVILPPVPFHRFPTFSVFTLECPAEKDRAFNTKKSSSSLEVPHGSPFIYSPIVQAQKSTAQQARAEFVWQEGDTCCITAVARNPLPIDLDLTNLVLLTEGVACDALPAHVTIASQSESKFTIKAIPTQPGLLKILGYQTLVLGCRSNCRFRDLPQFELPLFEVKVIPRLPHVTLTLKSEQRRMLDNVNVNDDRITEAELTLYTGQSCECCVVLQNDSNIPIEHFQVTSRAKTHQSLLDRVLTFNLQNLTSQLPVKGHSQAVLTLYLNGAMACSQSQEQVLEASLLVEYSGGAGLEEEYCRHCDINLSIKLRPAAVVREINVQPSFSAESCSVEVCVENVTDRRLSIAEPLLPQECLLSSHSLNRFKLLIPRCKTDLRSNQKSASSTQEINQSHPASQSNVQSSQLKDLNTQKDLANQIREHLQSILDVRWTMIGSGVGGKLELADWPLTKEQLQYFCLSPVSMSVCVNKKTCSENDDVIVTSLSIPVLVTCSATNISDCDIADAECCIRCTQRTSQHSQHASVFLGQSAMAKQLLHPGESISLDTEIQLLCPGQHVIKVQTQGQLKDSSGSSQGQKRTLFNLPNIEVFVTDDVEDF